MKTQTTVKPLFDLGMIVATPGALDALDRNSQNAPEFLQMHENGYWGVMDAEDLEANDGALLFGGRLLSSYYLADGTTKLWIITEADRSTTTLLLPEEY